MVANSPGILPKTALVASRAVYYPFTIPQQLNDSATKTGQALNGLVKNVNASIGNAYAALEPRGPAKWLLPIFAKVDAATDRSEQIAQRNKAVFWDPFSQGVEGVGRAIASPGAYWYLRKAGVEQPTQDMIKGVLNMPLFAFPEAAPSGGGSEPGPSGPPPTEAPSQASEGAAQTTPPAEEQPAA